MPLQELSPLPPVTGYSALGGVLSNLGQDQLQRSRQLADVASARQYASAEGDKRRMEQLQDTQTLDKFRAQQAGIQLLINEGYLDGSKRDDPAAVQAAYQAAKADGVDKRYLELYQTPDPDTGQPLLKPTDAGNPALVQAAKDKLAATKARLAQSQLADVTAGRETANVTGKRYAATLARANALESEADKIVPAPVTDDEVRNYAYRQLALSKKPGEKVSDDEVANAAPQARKELEAFRFSQAQAQRQALAQEAAVLRAQGQEDQKLLSSLANRGLFPNAGAWASGSGTSVAVGNSKFRAPSPEEAAAALAAAKNPGNKPPPTPPPPSSGLLDNPTNDATVAAGNEVLKRQQAAQIQSQLNDAIQEKSQVGQQIAAARNTSAPMTIPAFGGGYMGPSPVQTQAPAGVLGAAQNVSSLLKRDADLSAKIKALQAQLVGPVPATATAPVINSPTASTPTIGAAQPPVDWWHAPNPAPISGM